MTTPVRTGSWFGERTEPPSVGLPPQRIADVLCEELREIPLHGFPLAVRPLVVPLARYRELLSATTRLLDLLRRTALALAPDRAGRIAALGTTPEGRPTWVDDEDFEVRHCADLARADVVVGADGPKFIEFNVSGSFGGLVQFQSQQRAWRRIRELAGEPSFVGVDAYSRLAGLVERTCAELGVPPSVVLVGTPREWGPSTSRRNFTVQADLLRQHGIHAEHFDFEDLLDGIGVHSGLRHPLGIGQFTVQDAERYGYDIGPVATALAAGFRLVPSATSWLLHNKKLLALVSAGVPSMTDADRALVARYVPWTRLVGDHAVEWRGDRHHLPALLLDRQDAFVLKGATGCAGEEVVFGDATDPREWARLVDEAVRGGYHVAQEVVAPVTHPLDVIDESGRVERIAANTVISPFAVDGGGAGCFVRFVGDPRPGVISAVNPGFPTGLTCLLAQP